MPPRGGKGGRRPGAGCEPKSRGGIRVGRHNVAKWVLLREALGYADDDDFAAFLLQLAEECRPATPRSSPAATTATEPGQRRSTDDEDSGEGAQVKPETARASAPAVASPAAGSKPVDEARGCGDEDEAEPEDEDQARGCLRNGEDPELPGAAVGEPGREAEAPEQPQEEENDSPSEDEKDFDWTPTGIRVRCMRRSTRAATLKSKRVGRQTRARARILTPQKPKRKRSASEDIRKAPPDWAEPPSLSTFEPVSLDETSFTKPIVEKIRTCVDCGQKHQSDSCPLYRPLRVILDTPIDPTPVKGLSRAELSLPKMLKLAVIDKSHGPSVVATNPIEQYTQFGPIIGQGIYEADIHEDSDLKNIWEIFHDNMKLYLDTTDADSSNWLRFLRPSATKSERNVSAVPFQDGLYFVTIKDVAAGTELTYWSEDPTVAWSRKKMEKTSCGGCNQKFVNSLYYRMHCMIFHDPNYSLTIRKYHCKICGVAVIGKENIMRHASEMHDGKGAYQCQYCKKFFLRLNYLDMHRTYGCKLNPRRSRPLCDLCGKKFCQPQKLKVHIRRMHSDIAEVLKEFQCKSCFKLLGSRAALQRHLKEVHNKDQNIAATCDRCGKTFQNKSNLKIHMLTHSGVKPFRCTENGCTAAFTTKQCLQFHYKKVHGYTMETMPSIERCIAYTFESYSGGQGDDEEDEAASNEEQMTRSIVFGNPHSVPSMTTASDLQDSSSVCSSGVTAFPAKDDILMPPTATPVQGAASPPDDHQEMDSLEALALEPCRAVEVKDSATVHQEMRDPVAEAQMRDQMAQSREMLEPQHLRKTMEDKDMAVQEIRRAEEAEDSLNGQLASSPMAQVDVMSLATDPGVAVVESRMEEDHVDMKGQVFDQGDVERMESSDVDLDTDLDDNISEQSLELDPRDNPSPVMMSRPQHQQQQMPEHALEQDCIPHVAAAIAASSIYGTLGGRHLIKDDVKDFTNEMVASMACDFAIVRHYAASLSAAQQHQHQQQSEYAMQMRHHLELSGCGGGGVEQMDHRQEEDDDLGAESSSAEDLSSTLTRYELERHHGSDPSAVKVEADDLSGMCEDLTKRQRLSPDDLLAAAADGDEEEEEDDAPRDDLSMGGLAAQHEHSINQFLRHQMALAHSRDLERLPVHSLDLSLPRTTAHLLEHLARTTAVSQHPAEAHMAQQRPLSSSPEEACVDSPPSRGLHLGQLPFHGLDLPRPLPHRLDHLALGLEQHMARSSPSQGQETDLQQPHLQSPRMVEPLSPPQPPPPQQALAHGIEHLARQVAPHGLDGHMVPPYVVDHMSRLPPPPPPSHAMDSYARGSMEAALCRPPPPQHAMDNLSRAAANHGMEFLSRLSPLPRVHRLEAMARTFSYPMEHADAYLAAAAAEHLSRPPSYSSEQRATPHSLDLSTSRGAMDSPPQHEGGGRPASPPSYQECSPSTPSSSSSSYQAAATPSSAVSHPPPTSPVPTSSVHSNYPTYLEYY